jgi:hypothetical protein
MANGDIVTVQALANRALPSAISDNVNGAIRISRRGEQMMQPLAMARHVYADEGTYFINHNNTNDSATTLAGHPAPVLADADATMTKPLIHMIHGGAATSQVRCYLDYIQIEVVTANASGTTAAWAVDLDTGTNRYSSGTVETFGVVNPNMQSSATSVLVTKGGPFVATAEGASARKLAFGAVRQAIEFTGDIITFAFGADPALCSSNLIAGAASHHVVALPPVILGPTDQLLLALYAAASASGAGIYKVRCGWVER